MTITKTSGGGAGQYFKSQSRRYAVYQPGKSQLIYLTGILNPSDSNTSGITSNIGYFDDQNGMFFSYKNGAITLVTRNSTSDTSVARANWNIDPMDGTGSSRISLDFTKEQFFAIEFGWLGIAAVRWGFLVNSKIYYCHMDNHYNELTAPYINSPNLPVRYELWGDAANDTGSIVQGCASVISEGGYVKTGRQFAVGMTTKLSPSGESALIAITGNSNYYHHDINLTSLTTVLTTNTDAAMIRVRLYLGGTDIVSSGSVTWSDVNSTYSLIKYATNDDNNKYIPNFTTTNSIVIMNAMIYSRNTTSFSDLTNTFTQITSNILNESDTIVITVEPLLGSCETFASLNWEEVY